MRITEWETLTKTLKKLKKAQVRVLLRDGKVVKMRAIYEDFSAEESWYIYSEGPCEELRLFGATPNSTLLLEGSSHYRIKYNSRNVHRTSSEELGYLRDTAGIDSIEIAKRVRGVIRKKL